jgi:hypothetical protein
MSKVFLVVLIALGCGALVTAATLFYTFRIANRVYFDQCGDINQSAENQICATAECWNQLRPQAEFRTFRGFPLNYYNAGSPVAEDCASALTSKLDWFSLHRELPTGVDLRNASFDLVLWSVIAGAPLAIIFTHTRRRR